MRFFLIVLVLFITACSFGDRRVIANEQWVEVFLSDSNGVAPLKFNRIADALVAIENAKHQQHFNEKIKIVLSEGEFREKLSIRSDGLIFIGQGPSKTKIVFDDYAGRLKSSGESIGTAGSATIRVDSSDVAFVSLTIENDFDFLYQDGLDASAADKVNGTQAVAVHLSATSDKVYFNNVKLLGYQDTLFADGNRAYITNSFIAGNVDFIFGHGNLVITHSEIHSRKRAKSTYPSGFVTAPSTKAERDFGITIIQSKLTRDPAVPNHSVALGRPWHPTTTFPDGRYADPFVKSKAVFIDTWMDEHVMPEAWYWMGGTTKAGTKEPIYPEGERFFEWNSYGPGALKHEKRRMLSSSDRPQYALSQLLNDWYETVRNKDKKFNK